MSDAIAFEYQGKTVGVLARHGEAFVFYSGVSSYRTLDGRLFAEPRDLYLALRRAEDERPRARGVARAARMERAGAAA